MLTVHVTGLMLQVKALYQRHCMDEGSPGSTAATRTLSSAGEQLLPAINRRMLPAAH